MIVFSFSLTMMECERVSIGIETPGGHARRAILVEGDRCAELNGVSKCAIDIVEGKHKVSVC